MATTRASSARAAVDLAFEELYRGHRADVYRAALRELGNAHDAEDVTQAAFADAYRAVLRGTRPQSPRAWLLAISENVRRRRFRTAERRPREQLVDDADFPPAAELPYEQSRALAEALAGLPAEQRRVFVLREIVGLSYTEIADEAGSTVASIQMLLFRARRSLREQLDPPTVAIRRPVFLPPVPSWLAGLFSRVELASLTPRAAGALGAAVLAVAGASVAVPVPQAGARDAARTTAAARAAAAAEPAVAPAPAKPTPQSVKRTAARQAVARVAPTQRPARPTPPAATLPPASVPATGPVPTPSRPPPRADAERARGRGGQASRSSSRCRRSAAAGRAAAGRAATGLRAVAPGPAPRPGSVAAAGCARRRRRRDRRGGRRWGERSAGAGSCGTSSDAAAHALGRGAGARSHAERAHPERKSPSGPRSFLAVYGLAVLIERSMHPDWLSNAYLLADEPGGTAVFIDSGAPLEPLHAVVERERLNVTHLLTTHSHPDHVAGDAELVERYGVEIVKGPLETGGLTIEALETPGHASDHLAFVANETVAFTADILFKDAVGAGPTLSRSGPR